MSKLHRIAIAAALAAAGGTASANIIYELDATELVFTAWSPTAQLSYVHDTGISIADMMSLGMSEAGWSFSVAVTDFYNNSALKTASDVKWGVAAYNTYDDSIAGDGSGRQLLTTVVNSVNLYTTPGAPGMVNDNFNGPGLAAWINTNGTLSYNYGTHPTEENGSSITGPADGQAYWFDDRTATPHDNFNTSFAFSYMNKVGEKSQLWSLVPDANNIFDGTVPGIATLIGNSQHAGEWTFDGTTVSYTLAAAVPEPSSVALMFAGLGVVGLLAKRRARR